MTDEPQKPLNLQFVETITELSSLTRVIGEVYQQREDTIAAYRNLGQDANLDDIHLDLASFATDRENFIQEAHEIFERLGDLLLRQEEVFHGLLPIPGNDHAG